MLVKVKDGSSVRMIHEGKWYNFSNGEVKDCPDSILSAFGGILVQALQQTRIFPTKITPMKIIPVEQPKIKIPAKKKKTK